MVGTPILILAALVAQRDELRSLRLIDLGMFVGVGGVLLGLFLTYVGSLSVGTPAATAVLLLYSQPAFTVVLSRFLGEKITRIRLAALVLGVSGVLVVLNPLGIEGSVGTGEALALTSGFLYAVYIVTSRKIASSKRFPPLTMTSLSFVGALVILLPVGLLAQGLCSHLSLFSGIVALDAHQAELLLGLISLGTVIPYLALNLGLVKKEASDTGLTLMIEPVSASVLGYLALGQTLGVDQVIGACLIIASIVLVNLGSKSRP